MPSADYCFFVSVEVVVEVVAVIVVVVPVVEVIVDSVPVVAVPVVPVSLTTAGDSVVVVVVDDSVDSCFLHPVANAVTRTAARPNSTNFFISLISFFQSKKIPL
jgi:hypothetical protein